MSDDIVLLFLRHLLPEWAITRDVHGVWRTIGRVHGAASSVDGLLDVIRAADPGGVERAARRLGHGVDKVG
ncbi:hypothetical protein BJF79_00220 [Actinomadura sp. CNU-125]|uniref:hypothetical protein n=1 Tax=Actinomadura sp. CNU-125 TaxID=1904961 RepID=UPI00095E93B3|nr:hypothetical protein [Actinomadura sp. CNU-125]OLT31672.1 hypothetical protein BJF79_00220 [Actinomadura sp. CNU-125]